MPTVPLGPFFIMRPKHVVFITYSNGFPNGMAATQRIKLLSKGLLLNGFRVTILCVRAIERSPVENVDVKGCYQGVDFEYTSGTTTRAKTFITRRWLEIRGVLVSIFRLLQFKVSGEIDCIYLYGTTWNLSFIGCFYRVLTEVLRIPLLIELNERPWSLGNNPSFMEKIISPLILAKGVIVISSFLYNWVQVEAKQKSKKVAILYIPILVDTQEAFGLHTQFNQTDPVLLFAGAPQYDETIRFLFESMKTVVKKYPLCRFIITGIKNTDPAGIWLRSEKTNKDLLPNIHLIGYVSRSELLTLYQKSNALLIPLFNDVRSQARFPTKLGEYLCSGRPVITNNIGELTKYLVNDFSAFLCEAGDPTSYGETICNSLNDPVRANEIGLHGKEVAQQQFDYSLWGKPLSEFITKLRDHSA
jgi:glycosyltransferase involved in cell wall biosynthesis